MLVASHVSRTVLDLARNEVRAHFEFPAFLGPHAFPHVDKQPHPSGRDNHGRQQYGKKEQSYFSNHSHILYHSLPATHKPEARKTRLLLRVRRDVCTGLLRPHEVVRAPVAFVG